MTPSPDVQPRSDVSDPQVTRAVTWTGLIRVGAVAAAVFVVMVLVPVVLVFMAPLPPTEGRALLEYIDAHRWVYLVELVSFVGLAIPALLVFTALGVALWRHHTTTAVVGALVGVVSETIALALASSPQSLHGGLVVLADEYAATSSPERRESLVAAAEALVATTNAVSWAGVLTAAAIALTSWAMRGTSFGRLLVVLGVVTGILGVVSEALRPLIGGAYTIYGLLLPIWFALAGWRLFRLGGSGQRVDDKPAAFTSSTT